MLGRGPACSYGLLSLDRAVTVVGVVAQAV